MADRPSFFALVDGAEQLPLFDQSLSGRAFQKTVQEELTHSGYQGAPFVRGSETSKAAAKSMVRNAAALREQVWQWLWEHGPATTDAVEVALAGRHQSVSPRFWELARAGRIVTTGEKRPTRSGRLAACYRAVVPEQTGEAA